MWVFSMELLSYLFLFWYRMHELPLFDESLKRMGTDKQLFF